MFASVAQLVGHSTVNREVASSILAGSGIFLYSSKIDSSRSLFIVTSNLVLTLENYFPFVCHTRLLYEHREATYV